MALSQNYSRMTSPNGIRFSQLLQTKSKQVREQNMDCSNFVILTDKDKRVCKGCVRAKKFIINLNSKKEIELAQPIDKIYNHVFGCNANK